MLLEHRAIQHHRQTRNAQERRAGPLEDVNDLVGVEHADGVEIALQTLETADQIENDAIAGFAVARQRLLAPADQVAHAAIELGLASRGQAGRRHDLDGRNAFAAQHLLDQAGSSPTLVGVGGDEEMKVVLARSQRAVAQAVDPVQFSAEPPASSCVRPGEVGLHGGDAAVEGRVLFARQVVGSQVGGGGQQLFQFAFHTVGQRTGANAADDATTQGMGCGHETGFPSEKAGLASQWGSARIYAAVGRRMTDVARNSFTSAQERTAGGCSRAIPRRAGNRACSKHRRVRLRCTKPAARAW